MKGYSLSCFFSRCNGFLSVSELIGSLSWVRLGSKHVPRTVFSSALPGIDSELFSVSRLNFQQGLNYRYVFIASEFS